jgi:hypothetical protein
MNKDPIRGKTIRWTFSDGPMAKRTFEHSFDKGGTVSWRMLDGNGQGKLSEEKKYESVHVGHEVHAISYLGSAGYTLTVVLDFGTGKLVAFASNEGAHASAWHVGNRQCTRVRPIASRAASPLIRTKPDLSACR